MASIGVITKRTSHVNVPFEMVIFSLYALSGVPEIVYLIVLLFTVPLVNDKPLISKLLLRPDKSEATVFAPVMVI
ncbi:hypothetical protein FACS189459_6770 [Bacilli bacterium]|nr:hypothetical protein FACS189459_6770 [Bacilli bacterium]